MNYAFLLYDSRSGSTLLSSLLNLFSGVVVTQESAFMPLVLESYSNESQLEVDGLIDLLYSEPQFCDWNIDRDVLRNRLSGLSRLTHRAVFDAVIAEYLKVRGADEPELLVVKGPRYEFHMGTFRKMYGNPKFINLIRDGRAVYNSKLDMVSVSGLKMSNNVFQSAFEWKKKLKGIRGESVLNLRFEDLVGDSNSVVLDLLDRLGVSDKGRDVSSSQEEFHKLIGGSQKHLHSNVKRAPDKAIAVKWMQRLSPAEIWLFEKLCARELLANGYTLHADPDTSRVSIAALVVRDAAHWVWLKLRNIIYYTFVDKSIMQKLKGKRFE